MKKKKTIKRIFTATEAARYAGLGVNYLYRLIRDDQGPAFWRTRTRGERYEYRFNRSDLNTWIENRHDPKN